LLKNIDDSQRIQTRNGRPTPDDLDELLSKVWKEPSFFLAHPRAIAAFQREATRRGVPPVTVNLHGGTFILWRGIPLIPSDKLFVDGLKNPKGQGGKTNILLIRSGESKRGVLGLYQEGLPNEQSRGLSVRFRGSTITAWLPIYSHFIAPLRSWPMTPLPCWKMLKWVNIMTTSNLFTLPYAPGGWAGDAPSARDYGLPDARDLQGLLTMRPHARVRPKPLTRRGCCHWARRAGRISRLADSRRYPASSVKTAPPARVGQIPVERIRADFPILSEQVDGHPLVWLDNAATTQRPKQVIDRISHYYLHENSNVHRAAHTLPLVPPMLMKPRVRKCRVLSAPAARRISSSCAAPRKGSI
jgi:hypothetical protein